VGQLERGAKNGSVALVEFGKIHLVSLPEKTSIHARWQMYTTRHASAGLIRALASRRGFALAGTKASSCFDRASPSLVRR
jgi:hypothetical protein